MNQEISLSRKIIISSPIDSVIAHNVIAQILDINEYDDAMSSALKGYEPQPIELYINSGGGSATDGFAIIGAMEMSETPIVTYGFGLVGSMALGIFVKGDYRIAHRYTRFMYHSVGYDASGYIKDHEEGHKEANILQEMYNDLFIGTGITSDIMQEVRERKIDFFFTGKEAVKLKIADNVLLKPEKKFELLTDEQVSEFNEEISKLNN